MIRPRLLAGLLAIVLGTLPGASARELLWPGIIGKDDREMADSIKPPWRSVGRFNYAGYREIGFCTGTLVAPTIVITAAHCFFHPDSRRPLPEEKFRFVLGLHRDRYIGIGRIRCIHLHPDFDPSTEKRGQKVYADVAAVILEEPLNEPPLALAADDTLAEGATVSHAGYGRDRPYLLSLHRNCRILSTDGRTVLTNCDTNFGQSGGPLIIDDAGTPRLLAIMSGFTDQLATWAAGVPSWRSLVDDANCPSRP